MNLKHKALSIAKISAEITDVWVGSRNLRAHSHGHPLAPTHSSVLEPSVYMCRDGGRPAMRARKCWWSSASATTAFFPLIHVVLTVVCCFFQGGRVYHEAVRLVQSHARFLALSVKSDRYWTVDRSVEVVVLVQVILLAWEPSGRFLSHIIVVWHCDGVLVVVYWPQPPFSPHEWDARPQDTFSHIHSAKHPTSSMLVQTKWVIV